jgi:hypothetical protein
MLNNKNIILFFLLFCIIIFLFYKTLIKNHKFFNNEYFTNTSLQDLDEINKFYMDKSFITVDNSSHGKEYNLTYGELTIDGLKNIQSYLKNKNLSKDIFIDLGSGNGRTLFYSIILGFSKAKGVEIVKERHDFATRAKNKLNKFSSNIKLLNDDLFKLPKNFFSNNSVIFISNLVFPIETTQKIFEFLNKMLEHDNILVVSKIPDNLLDFKLLDKIKAPMSWSKDSDVYILKK